MRDALKGIKVLDLTMNLPGPFMTWLMAEMGAEILKVEPPDGGDTARAYMDPNSETYFPVFQFVNRGKKSVILDFDKAADIKVFKRLVGDYDIVVEGFRPGAMKKKGIDYEHVKTHHPSVIFVSITGYGQSGYYAKKGGHDINYQALAGSFDSGSPITSPQVPPIPTADLGGGSLFALSGLLAAIIQRDRTGQGTHLDVSMVNGAFTLNVFGISQAFKNKHTDSQESHFLSGHQPFYQLYETKDHRYMSLGALEQKFWIAFCQAVGRDDLISRQFGGENTIRVIADIFKTKTQADWIREFEDKDICCEPVLTIQEAMASGLFRDNHQGARLTADPFAITSPIQSVGEKQEESTAPPSLGQHNGEITRAVR